MDVFRDRFGLTIIGLGPQTFAEVPGQGLPLVGVDHVCIGNLLHVSRRGPKGAYHGNVPVAVGTAHRPCGGPNFSASDVPVKGLGPRNLLHGNQPVVVPDDFDVDVSGFRALFFVLKNNGIHLFGDLPARDGFNADIERPVLLMKINDRFHSFGKGVEGEVLLVDLHRKEAVEELLHLGIINPALLPLDGKAGLRLEFLDREARYTSGHKVVNEPVKGLDGIDTFKVVLCLEKPLATGPALTARQGAELFQTPCDG